MVAENDGRKRMGENSITPYSIGGGTEGKYFGEGSSGRAYIGLSDDGRKRTFSMAESSIE